MQNQFLYTMTLIAALTACTSASTDPSDADAPTTSGGVRTAMVRTPTGVKSIQYELVDGRAIYQGDIILNLDRLGAIEVDTDLDASGLNTVNQSLTTVHPCNYWENGTVYFVLDPNLPATQRNWFWQAMAHWQINTPIRFRQGQGDGDYIRVLRPQDPNNCSADVGRVGGEQEVLLGDNCGTAATIHELGHTVGLWHEQSRSDRDAYVDILLENVQDQQRHNFQTYLEQGSDGLDYGPYDYYSIMHYGPFDFSDNNLPTIRRDDGSALNANTTGLSTLDRLGVHDLYCGQVLTDYQLRCGHTPLPWTVFEPEVQMFTLNATGYGPGPNLDFGPVTHTRSHRRNDGIILTSFHDENLTIRRVYLEQPSSVFSIEGQRLGELQPGDSMVLDVTVGAFTQAEVGARLHIELEGTGYRNSVEPVVGQRRTFSVYLSATRAAPLVRSLPQRMTLVGNSRRPSQQGHRGSGFFRRCSQPILPTAQGTRSNFLITNDGNTPLDLRTAHISGEHADSFRLVCLGRGVQLAPGASVQGIMEFEPPAGSLWHQAELRVGTTAGGTSIGLAGYDPLYNSAPDLEVSRSSVSFGLVAAGCGDDAQSVVVTNTGSGTMVLRDVVLSSGDTADYFVNTARGVTIPAGGSQEITVGFRPRGTGSSSATLTVNTTAGNADVRLSGFGHIESYNNAGRLLINEADGSTTVRSVSEQGTCLGAKNLPAIHGRGVDVELDHTGVANVLFDNGGRARIARMGVTGDIISQTEFGPYGGWRPTAFSVRSDGTRRLLWTHVNGWASLWSLDSNNAYRSHQYFGPYSGWSAIDYAQSAQGAKMLWAHENGSLSVWTLDASDQYLSYRWQHGYEGWEGQSLCIGADGNPQVLWQNISGQVNLWSLNAGDAYASHITLPMDSGTTATSYSAR